jgi:hypothetical protein
MLVYLHMSVLFSYVCVICICFTVYEHMQTSSAREGRGGGGGCARARAREGERKKERKKERETCAIKRRRVWMSANSAYAFSRSFFRSKMGRSGEICCQRKQKGRGDRGGGGQGVWEVCVREKAARVRACLCVTHETTKRPIYIKYTMVFSL